MMFTIKQIFGSIACLSLVVGGLGSGAPEPRRLTTIWTTQWANKTTMVHGGQTLGTGMVPTGIIPTLSVSSSGGIVVPTGTGGVLPIGTGYPRYNYNGIVAMAPVAIVSTVLNGTVVVDAVANVTTVLSTVFVVPTSSYKAYISNRTSSVAPLESVRQMNAYGYYADPVKHKLMSTGVSSVAQPTSLSFEELYGKANPDMWKRETVEEALDFSRSMAMKFYTTHAGFLAHTETFVYAVKPTETPSHETLVIDENRRREADTNAGHFSYHIGSPGPAPHTNGTSASYNVTAPGNFTTVQGYHATGNSTRPQVDAKMPAQPLPTLAPNPWAWFLTPELLRARAAARHPGAPGVEKRDPFAISPEVIAAWASNRESFPALDDFLNALEASGVFNKRQVITSPPGSTNADLANLAKTINAYIEALRHAGLIDKHQEDLTEFVNTILDFIAALKQSGLIDKRELIADKRQEDLTELVSTILDLIAALKQSGLIDKREQDTEKRDDDLTALVQTILDYIGALKRSGLINKRQASTTSSGGYAEALKLVEIIKNLFLNLAASGIIEGRQVSTTSSGGYAEALKVIEAVDNAFLALEASGVITKREANAEPLKLIAEDAMMPTSIIRPEVTKYATYVLEIANGTTTTISTIGPEATGHVKRDFFSGQATTLRRIKLALTRNIPTPTPTGSNGAHGNPNMLIMPTDLTGDGYGAPQGAKATGVSKAN